MKGKTRDFTGLTAALAAAAPAAPTPAAPPPPARAAAADAPRASAGRPATDTAPMTLRVPRTLLDVLLDAAADATKRERRTVTPQQLIIAALEAAYGDKNG